MPIEVKLNFGKAKLGAIKYFMENYKADNYRVAGLNGAPAAKNFIFPWQL